MAGGISRRVLLGGVASVLAGFATAEAPIRAPRPLPRPGAGPLPAGQAAPAAPRAATDAASLIAAAQLGGQVGYVVADARSGLVLESLGGDLALPPASVAKAVTAAYGLATLGGDFRFETRVIATGPVVDGRLEGDLVLAGGGDPVLDTDALAALVTRLKATGLREISGGFKVWAGALPYVRAIDSEQPDHVGYNPAVSGLNLNFNRVHFQWAPAQSGWAVSLDARSATLRPAVSVARMSVVTRDLPTYTYKDREGVDEWTVASAALGTGGTRWLPVRRPDLYAAEVFQVLAASHGLRLPRAEAVSALPGGRALVSHQSVPLVEIVRDMLKYSTNLVAEVLGLTASRARGLANGGLRGSARAMTEWMRATYGATQAMFEDHSGLGDDSRVSASDMVRMLVKAGPNGQLHALMKEIEPWTDAGAFDPGARHKIRAKTGTLNFVSALAGYVLAPDGTPLAFAVFTGDTSRRDRIAPEDMERPDGGRAWTGRARTLQQQLINRWVTLYGG